MTGPPPIGFDRRIDLEWLDATAGRVAAGESVAEVRDFLWNLLEGSIAGDKGRNSARRKTVSVLTHIWAQVPESALPLRARAVQALEAADTEHRLAIHWAMVTGTYPFVADVAAAIGRVLGLGDVVTLSLLHRRLIDSWGDRSSVRRAIQRVVRSMVQWGILDDVEPRGTYRGPKQPTTLPTSIALLLLEAILLHSESSFLPVEQLVRHPALFPFQLDVNAFQVRQAPQFTISRQGIDIDLVGLATVPSPEESPQLTLF